LSEKAGLREGDVLLRVDDTPFSNIEEVQHIISENIGKTLNFYIERTYACPENSTSSNDCPIIEYLNLQITP